jgi:hypothetical protein
MRTTLTLMLSVLAAGCTTAPVMKLAPELAAVPPKPVSGRQAFLGRGVLAFDRWTSTAPARLPNDRWRRSSNLVATGLNDVSGIETDRAALEFSVNSGGSAATSTTQSKCTARGRFAKRVATSGRVTDETQVNVSGYPRIDCEFSGAQSGQLSLQPSWLSQRDSGTVEFGDLRWTVESVDSGPVARFGYEFSSNGKVVAAVETYGAGRVWIDPSLDAARQDELAAATTALLYYASLLEYESD